MKSLESFYKHGWFVIAACLLIMLSNSGKCVGQEETKASQECETTAKKVLGAEAQVLACGQLSRSGELEVLTAIRLGGFKESGAGIPVSKFAILRRGKPEWTIELIADNKPVRNSVGYIGANVIDDSFGYGKYRILFSGGGVKDKDALSLMVRFIDPDGKTEAWPLEIDWNPSVGRFQEYSESDSPLGFNAENKSPKHIRSGK